MNRGSRFSRKAATASSWSLVSCASAWNAADSSSTSLKRCCCPSRSRRLASRNAFAGFDGDASRDGVRFVQQLIAGHDARDQSERLGGARVDRVAGQDHFRRARQADGPRQDPGAAVARHDADLDEAGSELGGVGRQPDVADAGQVEAEADRVAVDGRDHRHFAIPQGADHALDAAAVVRAGRLGRAEAADAAAGLHSLEVAAGAEAGSGAGQHDAADAGVLFGPAQGVDDVLAILLRADGVAALGAVQGQGDDAVGGGVLHEALGHLDSPVLQAAVAALRPMIAAGA